MNKRVFLSCSVLFLFFFLFCLFPNFSAEAASTGFFFEVSGGSSPVYLLGSLHLAREDTYPLSSAIAEAFENSDILVVEADILGQAAQVEQEIMERGFFHDGITLADVLSDTTYRRLAGRLSAYGHAVTDYQFVKPWLLALILSTLEATDASFEAIHGIEMYFLAQSGEKQIIELEGFSYQIDLFEGFSGEVQEQFLLSAIDPYPGEADSERIAEDLELLHELWISGNWEVFQTFSENLKALTAHIPGYNERFWNERSQNMARRIESFLTEGDGKTYFVIIGAGHLSGERGLVKLLREAGYRVEQITG